MKDDPLEKATAEFLQAAFSCPVIRHPNGQNAPPDFALGEITAIEVTRLTKALNIKGASLVLESETPRIKKNIENIVNSIENSKIKNQTYLVSFTIKLPYNRILYGKKVREALETFTPDTDETILEHTIRVDNNLTIYISRSAEVTDRTFVVAVFDFSQEGGWVLGELITQSKHALAKKKTKMAPVAHMYSEWWLAVGSSITHLANDYHLAELSKHLDCLDFWGGIIFLNKGKPALSKILKLNP